MKHKLHYFFFCLVTIAVGQKIKINNVEFDEGLQFNVSNYVRVLDSVGDLLGEGKIERGHKKGLWQFYKKNGTTIYRKYLNNIQYYDTIQLSKTIKRNTTNKKFVFNHVGKEVIGWAKDVFGSIKNTNDNADYFNNDALYHHLTESIESKKIFYVYKDSLLRKKHTRLDVHNMLINNKGIQEYRIKEYQFFNHETQSFTSRILAIAPMVNKQALFWVYAQDLFSSFKTGENILYDNLVFNRYVLDDIFYSDKKSRSLNRTSYWDLFVKNLREETEFIARYEQSQEDVLAFYETWKKNKDYVLSQPSQIAKKGILPFYNKDFHLEMFEGKIYAFTKPVSDLYYKEEPITVGAYLYDIAKGKWTTLNNTNLIKSNYLSVRVEDKMLFFNSDKVVIYDLFENTWNTLDRGSMNRSGYRSKAFCIGSKVYFLYGNSNWSQHQNKIWVYDLEEDVWEERNQVMPKSITNPKAFVCDERVFVMDKFTRTIYEYHYERDIWVKLDLFQPFIKDVEAISVVEDKLLFLLKHSAADSNVCRFGIFDINTKEYGVSKEVEISKEKLSHFKNITYQNGLYLMGGIDHLGNEAGEFIEITF